MVVIRHQAIGKNGYVQVIQNFSDEIQQVSIIRLFTKNQATICTTIVYVIVMALHKDCFSFGHRRNRLKCSEAKAQLKFLT